MYNFLFYCIYRTASIRKSDPIFDGSLYICMILVVHLFALVMLLDILLFTLFDVSLYSLMRIHMKWATGVVAIASFILINRYYKRHLDRIVDKYGPMLEKDSHWKWFVICILALVVNTGIFFGSIQLVLNLHK